MTPIMSLNVYSTPPAGLADLIGPAQNRAEVFILDRIVFCARQAAHWLEYADEAPLERVSHYQALAREATAEARALAGAVLVYREESEHGRPEA